MEFYIRRQTVGFCAIDNLHNIVTDNEQMKAILDLSPTASLREIVS